MANLCYFESVFIGSQKGVDILCDLFKKAAFVRVRDFFVTEECDLDNGLRYVYGKGTCAWSLYISMISLCDNIIDITRDFGLYFEAYSEETGFRFQEHYIIDKGIVLKDECIDFCEFEYDPSDEETIDYILKTTNLTEAFLRSHNKGDIISCGGYPEWKFELIGYEKTKGENS